MRLSEKYGRWGIVCGGTIGQGGATAIALPLSTPRSLTVLYHWR